MNKKVKINIALKAALLWTMPIPDLLAFERKRNLDVLSKKESIRIRRDKLFEVAGTRDPYSIEIPKEEFQKKCREFMTWKE
jgi:hypothetical protein